jgi:hypothetical protein
MINDSVSRDGRVLPPRWRSVLQRSRHRTEAQARKRENQFVET